MNTPSEPDIPQLCDDYALVEKALYYLDENAMLHPDLKEIARAVGLSESHVQRVFSRWVGISPKRFLQFLTREHARQLLDQSVSMLDATFQVGLTSSGRLHDLFVTTEAVTPGEYKNRGAGLTIRYSLFPSPFGKCLIGITERGICHLGFVQTNERQAIDEFCVDWKQAKLVEDSEGMAPLIKSIFNLGLNPFKPLHVYLKGTNFQIKVWEALLRIPSGSVKTYESVAKEIKSAGGSRAVGNALARNPVPVLIPCHRVIHKLGDFGQYRYGAIRKKALLGWEFARSEEQVVAA
jgi:AraC family transcriptional regulator of adaptative response/methylated-DNA-[protein]-cysteine methyltransferase